MNALPLMPKATAVWLVDNTTLTFEQIATFTGLHDLEVSGIADGEVAIGIKGADPIVGGQLERADIERCEKDPSARLRLKKKVEAPELQRKGPRYTPLSKRQDRPAAIAWLVRYHPELTDGQISKLVGTTKPTIESVREKTHWNMPNIRPVDPVALGLCKQMELDTAVAKASRRAAQAEDGVAMSHEERMKLLSTDQSLSAEPEPARPTKTYGGLENFSLSGEDPRGEEPEEQESFVDAESLFNLPKGDADEKDDAK